MSDDRPDALLKSALEKIVYFEARSEQLSTELSASRADVERMKAELAQAAQREIELRREQASLQVAIQRAHVQSQEDARQISALKSERTNLIGRLLEASRIHASDQSDEQFDASFDLASFISELRREVMEVSAKGAAAQASGPTFRPQPLSLISAPPPSASTPAPVSAVAAPPSPVYARSPELARGVLAQAERLSAEGRLRVSTLELEELGAKATFAGKSEETLFGFSVRELSAPDAFARRRAAERLKALGQTAAAPALATALNGEQDTEVLVALLDAFAHVGSKEGAAVLEAHLKARAPEVRIGALKSLLALDPSQAAPQLSAALKDPDPAVRRRASLLALNLSGEQALSIGADAAHDEDVDVRALSNLILGAAVGEKSKTLLLDGLKDRELKVRKAAAQGLERILGVSLHGVAELEDATRRREIRRLATLPLKPVLAKAQEKAAPVEKPAPPKAPAPHPPTTIHQPPAPTVSQAAQAQKPARVVSEDLCRSLQNELRISIRGRLPDDLAAATGVARAAVDEACELLVARGAAVRRGQKFFAA